MLKLANETGTMHAEPEEVMADRRQFADNLGWLLSQTRERIQSAYLDDKDNVHVVHRNGGELLVNVTCDSYMAIVRDVAIALR